MIRTEMILLLAMLAFRPAAADEKASVDREAVCSATEFFRWVLAECLPENYEKNDNWGATHHLLIEHRLRFDGLAPRLEKRTRQVNHGLWRWYRISPRQPGQQLDVRLENVRTLGNGRATFDTFLQLPVHAEARQERWRYGVKLLNFSVEADATVAARLSCELAIRNEQGAVLIEPHIHGAKLDLLEFDLKRISNVEGKLAHELGELLEHAVADEVAEWGPKLAEKLNASIAKRQDRLRFTPAELVLDSWRQAGAALGLVPPVAAER